MRKKTECTNEINQALNDPNYIFRRGNIVWVDLPKQNENSSIQEGLRKCVIFSNTVNNCMSSCVHVVPLTSKKKNFKLHQKRKGHRDYYCPEQLQIINKEYILRDVENEECNEKQLQLLNDLVEVQLGIKDYRTINFKEYKENSNGRK